MELQLKELFCGKNFNTDAENWCWYCTCCNFHSCWNLTSAFIDLTSGSGLFIRSWFGFKGLFGWFCLTDLATLSVLTCKCDGTVTAHSFILHEGYFSILSPLNLKKKKKRKKGRTAKILPGLLSRRRSLTPKLEAANLAGAETLVEAVGWA